MIKLVPYLIMLMAFIPLASSGKIKPRIKKHISGVRNITADTSSDGNAVLSHYMERIMLFQDSLNKEKQKRIKEVGRSRPQAKPEKVERPDPGDGRQGRNPGNVQRPPADRPNARPGDRPPGGGGGGGGRPQGRPPGGR